MTRFMLPLAFVVVPLFLGFFVYYIDKGAVSRIEAGRLVIAHAAQKASSEQVIEESRRARDRDKDRIVQLEAEIEAIPNAEPGASDVLCVPGCKVQWK